MSVRDRLEHMFRAPLVVEQHALMAARTEVPTRYARCIRLGALVPRRSGAASLHFVDEFRGPDDSIMLVTESFDPMSASLLHRANVALGQVALIDRIQHWA
jgi:hypothetical protein